MARVEGWFGSICGYFFFFLECVLWETMISAVLRWAGALLLFFSYYISGVDSLAV